MKHARSAVWRPLCVAALALVVVMVPSLAAGGQFLPDGARGPLRSGQTYRAALDGDAPARRYYFYVSERGPVRMACQTGSASAGVVGIRAGYMWPVAGLHGGSWAETKTLDPGYYQFSMSLDTGEDLQECAIEVDGEGVTQTRPADVWPSLGTWRPGLQGTETFAAAPIMPRFYRVTPDYYGTATTQRFRFFVTTASTVWVGHGDRFEGYRDWGVHGRMFNGAFSPVGAPLNSDNPVVRTRLAPGVYYIKWTAPDPMAFSLFAFGVEGAYVTNHPYAAMTRPYAPPAATAGASFKSYGKISPAHAAGAHSVLVKAYRYERGHYVYKKSYVATIKDYTPTTSKYLARVVLPSAGKWRIRAYHRDAGHLKSYSSYRYVTVR